MKSFIAQTPIRSVIGDIPAQVTISTPYGHRASRNGLRQAAAHRIGDRLVHNTWQVLGFYCASPPCELLP